MPFKDNSFDIAFLFDVIHLVDADFNCLKAGGLAVVSVFYNDDNYREKREQLQRKLSEFEILNEFSLNTREKEFVVVARKK